MSAPTPLPTHPPTQVCPRCTHPHPQAAYHPRKWGVRGSYCKGCNNEYQRAWKAKRYGKPKRTRVIKQKRVVVAPPVVVAEEKITQNPRPNPLTSW